jgi:hypothetical protein
LGEPIVTQGFEINATTLASVFSQIKDRGVLVFQSKAKAEYDVAVQTYCLSQGNADIFSDWFKSQAKLMAVDGDAGYKNATAILHQMSGKQFDKRQLDLELGRAFSNGKVSAVQKTERVYGAHSGGSRVWDDSQQRQNAIAFTGGKSYRNEPAVEGTLERSASRQGTDAHWREKCTGIGNTHSQRASIARIFVTKDGEIDWQATFQKRTSLAQR